MGGVADEVRRLMPRDRWLLRLLADHHVLTTEQITTLAFPTEVRARKRLRLLYDRDVLDRFRHGVRPGSQSWRWCLGPIGAAVTAIEADHPAPRPSAVRTRTDRLAVSGRLGHLLGVNGFFCDLVGFARTHPGAQLRRWWPERRATAAVGAVVRPDGHGVWEEDGRRVPFWLEYDTGSEDYRRLTAKVTDGYAPLAATGWAWPVLFWLPTPGREDQFHRVLARTPTGPGVVVATATSEPGTEPAGCLWKVVGSPGRVRLVDLPGATRAAGPE
jgi:hypothetical protein